MDLQLRMFYYRLAQSLRRTLASLKAIWGVRLRSLHRHFLRLPLVYRRLLMASSMLVICAALTAVVLATVAFHYIYFDRSGLPAMEQFAGFEFSTIGHIYDINGQPLAELARERRRITRYEEIPAVVRDAILAAEDKNFFSHNGVDYSAVPRVMQKVRIGTVLKRMLRVGREDKAESLVMFRQGGSTITQQIVRGYFLRGLTEKENSNQLRPGVLSYLIGARSAKKLARKIEEMRLSVWLEQEMAQRFGSKRRAKEEILARYASYVYMGNGQYGFAAASEYYLGRPLSSLTAEDAGNAALLAGIPKSPSFYAPIAANAVQVLHRRNQILELMAKDKFLSPEAARTAKLRSLIWAEAVARESDDSTLQSPALVASALDELRTRHPAVSLEDLYQGKIQVYATADARVQRIVSQALEHGLEAYEKRHPKARGVIQGSIVVLRNSDASILAEAGGRQFYNQHAASRSDFNRATQALRQPGSAMKPIVYLAAFRHGTFTLETIVPDEPISVPDGNSLEGKSISNYDSLFKGMIPLREALAESRNAAAMWVTEQVGIEGVLETARSVGIRTHLRPYFSTALGASEVNLLELANAYRTIATGNRARPHIIRQIVRDSGETVGSDFDEPSVSVNDDGLRLIQEGLRGVVRMPGGTAHSLDSSSFPIAIMGKTGTTNNFKDALFVGSTFGSGGITVAIRIGFDDSHSLGAGESGGRVALPVFRQIMLAVYREKLTGPVPRFPADMEERISAYLKGGPLEATAGQQALQSPGDSLTETGAGCKPVTTLKPEPAGVKLVLTNQRGCLEFEQP